MLDLVPGLEDGGERVDFLQGQGQIRGFDDVSGVHFQFCIEQMDCTHLLNPPSGGKFSQTVKQKAEHVFDELSLECGFVDIGGYLFEGRESDGLGDLGVSAGESELEEVGDRNELQEIACLAVLHTFTYYYCLSWLNII